MRACSERFLAVMASGTQTIRCKADLLYNRLVIVEDVNLKAGVIDFDITAAVMARASITVAQPELVPVAGDVGKLTPYGYEIAISGGVVYADGTEELLPLIVGPIQRTAFDDVTLEAALEVDDRSRQVIDARLEADYEVAAGTNYATAIQALIEAGVPGLTYAFSSTSHTTPALVIPAQSDRWEQAQQMAKSIGCQLYFDGLGRCVLRDEPSLMRASAVWTFADGEDGLLISARLELDREQAYNRTVAYGQNPTLTGAVPRGVATDSDPQSPTFYGGPFGRKPRFYSSPFITTNEQAAQAALAIQAASGGVARGLVIDAVDNFAIEPGDVVLVERESFGISETHIIDVFSLGLTPGGG